MNEEFKLVWRKDSIGIAFDVVQEHTITFEEAKWMLFQIAQKFETGTGGIINSKGETEYILNISSSIYRRS